MNPPTTATHHQQLRTAAGQARLAPSVHNTQPWRFVSTGDSLEIYADWGRQLTVLDPTRRQLLISCGCAVFNARVSLAAQGMLAAVDRFPDPQRPELIARLSITETNPDWIELGGLDRYIVHRQTNRRHYEDDQVPPEVLHQLTQVVEAEQARLVPVTRQEHRLAVARLSQRADSLENADPAYRAELRRWTSDDPRRPDGVPAMAVPHVTGNAQDDVPIRDFDTRGMGWLPTQTRSGIQQCLLILGTDADSELSWLRAGEALEHLWLQATKLNYVISLFTQVIEVPQTRQRLRSELELGIQPHILLRVGHASRTSASMRRRLDDILTDRPEPADPPA
jgi:hypothetical protein